MKIQYLFPLVTLAVPFMVSARPASPELMRLQNADGTVVEARLFGDENFSYATTTDGLTILELSKEGIWKPAMRNGHLLRPVESDLNLLRAEQPVLTAPANRPQRMALLDAYGRSTYPTIGDDIHSAVVLIEFSDTEFTVPDPRQAFDDFCNKEGYDAYGSKGSARDYYIASSNGKFKPVFDVYGPVKVSKTAVYYTGGDDPTLPGSGKNGRFCDAIYESVKALDPEVDFSQYDYDGDGKIDNIFFFYAGHGQADTGNKETIWPHQGDYSERVNYNYVPYLKVDGVEMATYACSNELQGNLPQGASQPYLDGIGAFCHEYGHVLGLPDLYDVNYSGTLTPDKWSVMANGSYNAYSTLPSSFTAYEKWVCNWLEYTDAVEGTVYDIPSITRDGSQAVRVRVQRPGSQNFYNEHFVLETRSSDSWDSALPDEGLLIWQIDYDKTAWSRNMVNTNGRSRVKILTPESDKYGQATWPGENGKYSVNYPGITGALTPASLSPLFKTFLTDIAYDSETGCSTVGYNMLTDFPTEVTVLNDRPELTGTRQFRLNWEPVEGDVEYLVTVTRKDATGKVWAVDSYQDRSVGSETSALVRNITATAWKQDFEAYVKVAKMGVPAKKSSNVIKFVPEELSQSGVAQIKPSELGVSAGNGCIIAPEGAEVYNLSGVRTGLENLPSGVYIVKVGQNTVKVMVK